MRPRHRPADVIFSNPVKPPGGMSAQADADGVYRFGVDSDAEVAKLAPVRSRIGGVSCGWPVEPAASEVPSEGKFGVDAGTACRLLLAAFDAGLQPWAVGFHVGSQMTDPQAWVGPIRAAAGIMRSLEPSGIRLAALDIGGGFPADYGAPVPPDRGLRRVHSGCARVAALSPVDLVAEPGRGLVADAGRLETTVIGTAERGGRRWVHLDVGAFNGGMEALETGHRLVLPMTDSRGGPTAEWNVTGPSCDTLRYGAVLSAGLRGRRSGPPAHGRRLHDRVRLDVQRVRRTDRALRVRSLTRTAWNWC